MRKGGQYGAVAAVVVATVFFVIQIVVGKGQNYGLYAVLGAIMATQLIA